MNIVGRIVAFRVPAQEAAGSFFASPMRDHSSAVIAAVSLSLPYCQVIGMLPDIGSDGEITQEMRWSKSA